jgi:hypothetical protein
MDRAPAFYLSGSKPEVEGSKPSGPVNNMGSNNSSRIIFTGRRNAIAR